MKAITVRKYGSPYKVFQLSEVEKPAPEDHQVLIKVRAAAVNPADYQLSRGDIRIATGFFKPNISWLGYDVAGEVEAVGKNVNRFKPGDEVYGICTRSPNTGSQASWLYDFGCFAEYTLSHEDALALKPSNLTFEQAAAVPCTGLVALQGLWAGGIQAGQTVLISSATGGIGTFAVQIAKALGVEVTGVCNTKNMELVRSIGADRVIDYTREKYTRQGQRYDIVFDSIGDHKLSEIKRILNPGGKVVIVSARKGNANKYIKIITRVMAASILPYVTKDASKPSGSDLQVISGFIADGKVSPVIEKTFTGLSNVPQAIQYVYSGHAWGKVVVII